MHEVSETEELPIYVYSPHLFPSAKIVVAHASRDFLIKA